ncbi:hypothetical protein Trydic_g23414 [Trypoxylus dichotomus]
MNVVVKISYCHVTLHNEKKVNDGLKKKPRTSLHHNKAKEGVDNIFCNMLDISAMNSYMELTEYKDSTKREEVEPSTTKPPQR